MAALSRRPHDFCVQKSFAASRTLDATYGFFYPKKPCRIGATELCRSMSKNSFKTSGALYKIRPKLSTTTIFERFMPFYPIKMKTSVRYVVASVRVVMAAI